MDIETTSFDGLIAEGLGQGVSGTVAPVRHRRRGMTLREFLAIVREAWHETKQHWRTHG